MGIRESFRDRSRFTLLDDDRDDQYGDSAEFESGDEKSDDEAPFAARDNAGWFFPIANAEIENHRSGEQARVEKEQGGQSGKSESDGIKERAAFLERLDGTGGVGGNEATGAPDFAGKFYFTERAEKAAAFVADSDGAFVGMFETSRIAFGSYQALRIDFGGGPKEGGEQSDGEVCAALGTVIFDMRMRRKGFGQRTIAVGASDEHGCLKCE